MARSSLDYLKLLQSLLPKGKLWNRVFGSWIAEYLYGQAEELARIENRSVVLLKERNTLSTNEMITDHELELGLPDECTRDYNLILSERRLAANVKLTSTGQQDKQYFIDIANKYGYEATITEYTPFWVGIGGSGDPVGDQETIFYWKLTVYTEEEAVPFIIGAGAAGDPLQKISDLLNTIFCFVNKYKPAHTVLLTEIFGPGFATGFDSGFDSLPSQTADYLTGGFNQGFTLGFKVNLGGPFDDGFTSGFEKPR